MENRHTCSPSVQSADMTARFSGVRAAGPLLGMSHCSFLSPFLKLWLHRFFSLGPGWRDPASALQCSSGVPGFASLFAPIPSTLSGCGIVPSIPCSPCLLSPNEALPFPACCRESLRCRLQCANFLSTRPTASPHSFQLKPICLLRTVLCSWLYSVNLVCLTNVTLMFLSLCYPCSYLPLSL